jgi:N-acetyl-alpha-D-glucosaminyl L-malate synthase BshA
MMVKSDRLKIGVICHPTYGGSGVVASELALSLAQRGHQVHLFSHKVPPRLARAAGHVEVHVAQGIPYPLFHTTPHDLAITSAVLDLHESLGLDILHAHYALPHAVSALLARSAAQGRSGQRAPRVVTTLHGTDITLVGNDQSYAPLVRYTLAASDAVTAVSADLVRRTAENFGPEALAERIEVVPNFVDLVEFHPGVAEALPDSPPTVVHVSNFRPVKRVPWLVEAFALACGSDGEQGGADWRLLLVGDGPDQARSRRTAKECGIAERVTFLGTRDALPGLLAPADVYALASSEESFGLSALESMACGTPVLACDVGGVSEVVEGGVSGWLVDPDDPQAFAECLRQALGDREGTRAMGAAARERAETFFAREGIVDQYERVYREALEAPGS